MINKQLSKKNILPVLALIAILMSVVFSGCSTGGLMLARTLNPDLIVLDRMRMSQALGNVIRNALQHTEAGGHVSVAAEVEEGGSVGISVTDDGTGIDTADLPHIFDRFYHTDQSRARGTGGTGLGLPIARAIVEAHSGTIPVNSGGLEKGTTVRFDLPLP